MIFPESEPATISAGWLVKEEELIDKITQTDLAGVILARKQIEDLSCAIQEFTYPKEEQVMEFFNEELIHLSKRITQNYLLPNKINKPTISGFLDKLELRL